MVLAVAAGSGCTSKAEYKLGLVTFLSGGAAGPFGIPARNAGTLIVEAINAGTLPAPYTGKGIAGKSIRPIWVDEAGGASKQVASYRMLVQRQGVDAVVGYISSGDCLAVAPVAEALQKLTVFFDCGTPRVFEQHSYKYLFRTGATALMDNVGAARYVVARYPQLKSISGV
ncbi:MAG: ABC transporter substrate-binding protein, partial [Myxococcota bacterium]